MSTTIQRKCHLAREIGRYARIRSISRRICSNRYNIGLSHLKTLTSPSSIQQKGYSLTFLGISRIKDLTQGFPQLWPSIPNSIRMDRRESSPSSLIRGFWIRKTALSMIISRYLSRSLRWRRANLISLRYLTSATHQPSGFPRSSNTIPSTIRSLRSPRKTKRRWRMKPAMMKMKKKILTWWDATSTWWIRTRFR